MLWQVVGELEDQRDHLYEFVRSGVKGQAPAILETLRTQNAELIDAKKKAETQLRELKVQALASGGPVPGSGGGGASGGGGVGRVGRVGAREKERDPGSRLAEAGSGSDQSREFIDQLNEAEERAKKAEGMAEKLRSELETRRAENKQLMQRLSENGKSSTCGVM